MVGLPSLIGSLPLFVTHSVKGAAVADTLQPELLIKPVLPESSGDKINETIVEQGLCDLIFLEFTLKD